MSRIRRLPTALTVAALLALPACSSSGPSSAGSGAGSGSSTSNIVSIKNFSFQPKSVTVPRGTTITWTNKDDSTHTVTATSGHSFDSGHLSAGKSFAMTFTTPGTYSYMCSIHQYMHGTIIVR